MNLYSQEEIDNISKVKEKNDKLELFFNEIPILQQRFDYLKQLYYTKFPSEISDIEKEEIKKPLNNAMKTL